MNKNTPALAMGAEPEETDEELDDMGPSSSPEEGGDTLADDLELALDPASDPDTRAEAFRRAVKAAMS